MLLTLSKLSIVSLLGTFIFAAIISFTSSKTLKEVLVPAVAGVGFCWIYSYFIQFPNSISNLTDIPELAVLIITVFLAVTIGYLQKIRHAKQKNWLSILADLFLCLLALFLLIVPNTSPTTIFIFVMWCLTLYRVRSSHQDYLRIILMSFFALVGLSIIAWQYGLFAELGLIIGTLSIIIGIGVWLLLNRQYLINISFIWPVSIILLISTIRIVENDSYLVAPIFFIYLVYFADTAITPIQYGARLLPKLVYATKIISLSILPIIMTLIMVLVIGY
jgi:hypothetical protein|tara:strand:+ start:2187 stop:3014 length:828 start_codon:yes stop_codon:yes gene_type:complete